MWNSSKGYRVLSPAELAVYSRGAFYLLINAEHCIEDAGLNQEGPSGISIFDRMTPEQRIFQLAITLDALRDPMCPAPDLTSVSEGTVAAMLSTFERAVFFECRRRSNSELRELLVNVCKENRKVYGRGPRVTSHRMSSWELVIEVMHDMVLYDQDYDMDDIFGDLPSEYSDAFRESLQIGGGYYAAVGLEPSASELESAKRAIRGISGDLEYHGVMIAT